MLHDLNIPCERRDGKLVVLGNVFLCGRGLKELPDISSVEVYGNFDCSNNHLKSLKGAPHKVRGVFECRNNWLQTLEGCPQYFGSMKTDFGDFHKSTDIAHAQQMLDEFHNRAFTDGATEKIKVKKPLKFTPKHVPAGP